MQLTSEQLNARDLFLTGENLVIQAGAGTGKTSTLIELAKATTKRGQYIAFNRAIVQESRSKFPANVTCSTAHSLAFRAIAAGTPFEDRMNNAKRMRSLETANRLGIDALKLTVDGEGKLLTQTFLAGLVMKSIERFCQSADTEPTFRHVPRVKGLDPEGGPYEVNRVVAKHVARYMPRAWADLTSHEGGLQFTKSIAMSVFLKLWQLSDPRIGADFILFDEAQDANPVMVAIVAAQTHAQLVFVGDSQQQIYAFTGAIDALENLPDANTAYLTQSFRFGPAVATVANHVLGMIETAKLRLVGFDKITSTVAPVADPDVVLTRTNAEAVRTVLNALRAEKTVHLVGGGSEVVGFCKAAQALQNGERTDHAELAPFESWKEVEEYVADDEQGGDLKLMVDLINEFTAPVIIDTLERQEREDEADLVVSTAHKSKGRQWGSVQIANDFSEDRIVKSDDEKRLLYVAVTRAQFELDVTAIKFLSEMTIPTAEQAPVATTAAKARKVETETVESKTSEHVGRVGQQFSDTLTVESAKGMSTRYGWTHLTKMVDSDGNVFKAFIDTELEAGAQYEVEGKIKQHGEFNGVKETTLNYVDTFKVEVV